MNLSAIQAALRDASLDGWLFYDHHHRDPIAARILSLDPQAHVTRRWYYFIPATGEPGKLVHRIEQGRLDTLPGAKNLYSSWQELRAGIANLLQNQKKIAMQYSPSNDIMYVAMVDAGTVEFLRSLGKEIVTSADLVSQFEAVLSEEQISSHQAAQRAIDAIVAEAWGEIGRRLRPPSGRTGGLSEWDMVNWLGEAMRREGLVWENGPDVSVNSNTSDSHYEPTAEGSAPIREGDFLLIDIWGRLDKPGCIFYDITWTGVVGREPTQKEELVFETVRNARDAAIAALRDPRGGLRRVLHASHRTQHRTGAARIGRASRQPRNPRRAPHPAAHLLLGRARHLSAGVRRAQRGEHAHRARKGVGYRPDSAGIGANLVIME
jgi:Xaa-Pro aminopeptidase